MREITKRAPRHRGPLIALTAGSLIASGLLIGGSAMAGTTPPFGNAIDGENIGVGFDPITDPSGNTQELGPVNGSDTKLGVIHRAAVPMLATTNPNAQTDLNTVWLGSQNDTPDGDTWLYFAWKRDSSNGSGVIMYEFQKSAAPVACDYTKSAATLIASCNPWANRQAGDFVLVWDQVGSDPQKVQIILRTWQGPAGFNQPLTLSAGTVLTGTGNAYGDLAADGFSGEAAVNLSRTVFQSNTCTSIGNVIPGTVTGNSDTADYKDTVLTGLGNLNISNCGKIVVSKVTLPSGGTGTFGYTIDRASGNVKYPSQDTVTGTLTGDGDSDDVADLIPGTDYTITEQIGAGTPYSYVKLECTQPGGNTYAEVTTAFTVEAAKTTRCRITNQLQSGTLRVEKVVVNTYGSTKTAADFSFTIDGGSPISFSTNPRDYTYLNGTVVDVAEVPDPGYSTTYKVDGVDAADCLDLTVVANQTVTCTITNSDLQNAPGPGKTVQSWVLKDSFTLGGIRPGAADQNTASVTFRLFSDDTCTTQVGNDVTLVASAADYSTPANGFTTLSLAMSTAQGIAVSESGDYYWTAAYSGDAYNSGSETVCGSERTNIRAADQKVEGGTAQNPIYRDDFN